MTESDVVIQPEVSERSHEHGAGAELVWRSQKPLMCPDSR